MSGPLFWVFIWVVGFSTNLHKCSQELGSDCLRRGSICCCKRSLHPPVSGQMPKLWSICQQFSCQEFLFAPLPLLPSLLPTTSLALPLCFILFPLHSNPTHCSTLLWISFLCNPSFLTDQNCTPQKWYKYLPVPQHIGRNRRHTQFHLFSKYEPLSCCG